MLKPGSYGKSPPKNLAYLACTSSRGWLMSASCTAAPSTSSVTRATPRASNTKPLTSTMPKTVAPGAGVSMRKMLCNVG